MKPVSDFADMPFDRTAAIDDALIRSDQVLLQFSFEALPGLHTTDVKPVSQTKQKCRPFNNGMWRSWRFTFLSLRCQRRQHQRCTPQPTPSSRCYCHGRLDVERKGIAACQKKSERL